MAPDGVAQIDSEKCIECGACVYKCPFGATLDVSSITNIIKTIVDSDNNKNYHVHAIVAPAIAGQFRTLRQDSSSRRSVSWDSTRWKRWLWEQTS